MAPLSTIDIHGIYLSIGWAFLLDIGLICIKLLKYKANTKINYMVVHGIFSFLAWLASTIAICYVIYKFQKVIYEVPELWHDLHVKIGLTVLLLSTLQVLGGLMAYFLINRKRRARQLNILKKAHKYVGYFLWAITKFNLGIGAYFMGRLWQVPMSIYALVLFIAHLLIYVWGSYANRRKPVKVQDKESNKEEHDRLLRYLSAGKSKSYIKRELPNLKWVILGSRVYDVSKFIHPGGAQIINKVVGREVSRFMHGAYSIEQKNFKAHGHSVRAFQMLESYFIGNLTGSETILSNQFTKIDFDTTKTQDLSSVELLSQPIMSFKNDQSTIENSNDIWTLESRYTIVAQSQISQFNFINKNFKTKFLGVTNTWFGRHFNIKFLKHPKAKQVRTYTTALSLNESNTKLRNTIMQEFQRLIGRQKSMDVVNWQQFEIMSSTLPLFIKKYPFPNGFSKAIHECKIGDHFIVDGPLGRGLELPKNPTGDYYIFAAGTGILPFVDFLFIFGWKTLYDALKKEKGEAEAKRLNPFRIDFDEIIGDMKVHLFGAFRNQDDVFMLEFLEFVREVSQKYGIYNFEVSLTCYSNNLIHKIESRFNYSILQNRVQTEAEKYYVCGPPQFNIDVPDSLQKVGCDPNKITLI